MYICIYTYIYMYIYIYIYIHINPHTLTCTYNIYLYMCLYMYMKSESAHKLIDKNLKRLISIFLIIKSEIGLKKYIKYFFSKNWSLFVGLRTKN